MAVKVAKANSEEIKEVKEDGQLDKGTEIIIKYLSRIDAIEAYTKAIHEKVCELNEALMEDAGNPLNLLHVKTIERLSLNILDQVDGCTTEDLKP